MDTTLDAERQMIVAEVRRFVEREVIPVAHDLEHSDTSACVRVVAFHAYVRRAVRRQGNHGRL